MGKNLEQNVRVSTLAKTLNLTERRVQQLVKEGMPQAARGQYDLRTCAQWYIRYLQKALQAKGTENDDGTATSLREEKKRLVRAQADLAEIECQKQRGELLPVERLGEICGKFASTAHDRLIALPSKLASRLEGESLDVIRVKLFEAIKEALNGLAALPPSVYTNGSGDHRTRGTSKRVGGKRARAAKKRR